jgi:hypothetical protein
MGVIHRLGYLEADPGHAQKVRTVEAVMLLASAGLSRSVDRSKRGEGARARALLPLAPQLLENDVQALPVDVLHDVIRLTRVLADPEDGHDISMV